MLEKIRLCPKMIVPADIDETSRKGETPTAYVKRMALEKAKKVASQYPNENILACDTTVISRGKILHKAATDEEQAVVMRRISGGTNTVLSAVCLIDKNGKAQTRCVTSKVFVKRLSEEEIRDYVADREWVGACGYKIEGHFAGFTRKITGSYSGIVGLPLYETQNLLKGIGIK